MLSLFFATFFSYATINNNSISAASLGSGQTGLAAVDAGTVHDLNPAMLVHVKGRDLQTTFSANGWSAGLLDNSPDILAPAALAYSSGRVGEGDQKINVQNLRLNIAGRLSRNVSIGLTGLQRSFFRDDKKWQTIDTNLGLAWIARPNLGLAFVVYDLAASLSRSDLPAEVQTQRRYGIGAHYLARDFMRFRVDLTTATQKNSNQIKSSFGYESLLNEFVIFRLGYSLLPEENRELASIGLGLDLPQFRLNYGYQTTARGAREDVHLVDLGIPF